MGRSILYGLNWIIKVWEDTKKWWICIFITLIWSPVPAISNPATPGDFSSTATVINFDDLIPDQDLDRQYLPFGVDFHDGNGKPLIILGPPQNQNQPLNYDTLNYGNMSPIGTSPTTNSPPNGAGTRSNFSTQNVGPSYTSGATIIISFHSGQSRVGMYFGGIGAGTNNGVTLTAYDENGTPLEEVSSMPKDLSIINFIGLDVGKPVIRRVVLSTSNSFLAIDDLMFEPGPQGVDTQNLQDRLRGGDKDLQTALEALDEVMLHPSPEALKTLQTALLDNTLNSYVRERIAITLEQLLYRDAIPDLLKVAYSPDVDEGLMLAAFNSAYYIRKAFPPPDPPQINIMLNMIANPQVQGEPIALLVYATISATKDLQNIEALLSGGKGTLIPAKNLKIDPNITRKNYIYKGPLTAGNPITLKAEIWVMDPSQKMARISVRVKRYLGTKGDYVAYTKHLFIDLDTGTALPEPPQEQGGSSVHISEQGGQKP